MKVTVRVKVKVWQDTSRPGRVSRSLSFSPSLASHGEAQPGLALCVRRTFSFLLMRLASFAIAPASIALAAIPRSAAADAPPTLTLEQALKTAEHVNLNV